ncbi:MAG: amidase [Candidatus Dormibacteria bacterium]
MPERLLTRPAHELAQLLASGAVSPAELLAVSLERIAECNGQLNAVVHVAAEAARTEAEESARRLRQGTARPLEGIPVVIKDNRMVAGMPTRQATAMSQPAAATADAEVVGRLRRAGAVLVGKSSLPELGTLAITESVLHGPTRNPIDPSRTPGGSSGGSAAAVAAGMVPVAHGNDGGGSLRIPAACCGLFSIKPSRGRISLGPLVGDTPLSLGVDGFLTRDVRDNALLLDAVHGYATGDPNWAPPPARPFAAEVGADPGRLRIGWTDQPPTPAPVDEPGRAAVRAAAQACADLGHEVEEYTPPWQDEQLLPQFLDVWAVGIGLSVEALAANGGDPAKLEPHNRALWEAGMAIAAPSAYLTELRLQEFARRVVAGWNRYDVILTPALAEPPLPIGFLFDPELVGDNPLWPLLRAGFFTPFTPLVNVTGQPAASWPIAASAGLPVGVQAIGRPGDEATLLRLSAQVETAGAWRGTAAGLMPQP